MTWFSKLLRALAWVIVGLVVLAFIAAIVVYLTLRASRPQLDGALTLAGIKSSAEVTRDLLGVATIKARDTSEAAWILGFVHGQERFFEMDLTRRSAAGELSELFGGATIEADKEKRLHRFRARMNAAWQALPSEQRSELQRYADGVASGLASLGTKPWQYTFLFAEPSAWQPTDSLLVVAEMYSMLQGGGYSSAFNQAALRETVGTTLYDKLRPRGGTWDAALDGSVVAPVSLPSGSELDVRKAAAEVPAITHAQSDAPAVGSNAWAVGGALTQHGAGMLANDMHLSHSVPNIWFRAQIELTTPTKSRTVGVSLPGLPGMVAGSNGEVAWGFTNSYGRWYEWVPVTAPMPITTHVETIKVKGGDEVSVTVRETAAGPILKSWQGREFALDWLAHKPGAIDIHFTNIATARNVDDAIATAHLSAMPHQNLHVVDRAGNVAWTIAGKMAARVTGTDSLTSEFMNTPKPHVWLDSPAVPRVKNPPDHRVYSGNNRKLGGVGGIAIGEGGPDLGARAQQIRDRLRAREKFDEAALYAIAHDTEARFLKRWATLAESASPSAEVSALLKSWNGRADVDQHGYRLVRAFRVQVMDSLWKSWLRAGAPKLKLDVRWDARFEYAAWQAIEAQPLHLLPASHADWTSFLQAQFASVVKEQIAANGSLQNATWGARNTSRIRHPFSRVIPQLGTFLDMPAAQLSGDNNMPKVASPNFGASQRMVVAPGHEETGIFTMPGGQSGHPLSPFYGAGHSEWLSDKPAPLLAGTPLHTLTFTPKP